MNSEITIRQNIENTLKNFDNQPLREAATSLLNTLGYYSKRVGNNEIDKDRFERLIESALDTAHPSEKLRIEDWQSFYQIMQVSDEEINQQIDPEQGSLFESTQIDDTLRTSYMFVTVQLTKSTYTRTQLADITRFINKVYEKSIMVLFRYGAVLSLAIINRRQHQINPARQVLEKVTLIKDINLDSPKRAHIDIISELHLHRLIENESVRNFDTLHDAWEGILNTEELNKQFYRKLFAWYEWAVKEATFPTDENRVIKPEEHVIRLITRLLFIWFIKEKGLVADALFSKSQIQDLLIEDDFDNGDAYYRAVLQNLFFATLNTETGKRTFSKGGNSNHRNFSRYRYKKQMRDTNKLLSLFAQTPFINGGLFDCLDSFKATKFGGYRIDCFSDEQYHKLSIPNRLFFDENRGLLPLLEHYKFTVEENTPVDQEVALDPELLGRVFEHLLATLNPETGKTVRKETGSYYTPRLIVDYMVDEALVATLSQKCSPTDSDTQLWEERLRYLFDYAQMFDDASEWFDDRETDAIVKTISELKVLDPAVGSGAFPMGILHKLTLALQRLDLDNARWEALQKELAGKRAAAAFNTQNQQERDDELTEISDTFERYRDSDFGRKLYLIQNSIFGVDIQPIACQIAKLRFFISLAIEQEPDRNAKNFGIKPLPNLETRFVAANTLIGLDISETEGLFQNDTVQQLLKEIDRIRERFFLANNRTQKRELEAQEEKCREQLENELEQQRTEWTKNRQTEIESKIAPLPNAKQREQMREKEQKAYKKLKEKFDDSFEDARKIAQWKPYDQNAKADWFEPERMFGFTDGFDIVIGNPPYGAKIESSDLKQIKGNIKDTKNSNSAALFIDYAKNYLIKTDTKDGIVAFIVPKSLLFSERWLDLRSAILENTTILIDVEKAFEKVKLEQVVFIWNSRCSDSFYVGRKFLNNLFTRTTRIDKKYPKKFQAWICDVSEKDIILGSKIEGIETYLRNISETKRGLSIQKNLRTHGDTQVIGGKEVKRYQINGIKGYINRADLNMTNEKIQFLLQPKVISQRLVAHIQNPYPHIKVTSTVDKNGKILSVDTVENTVITDSNFDPVFIAALFNSTLINWYTYRFIFCCAIRTMDFDNYYVGKIPLARITPEQQLPIIELANQILTTKRADPDADTSDLENEIDKLVYELYNLTEDEIAIVEGSV